MLPCFDELRPIVNKILAITGKITEIGDKIQSYIVLLRDTTIEIENFIEKYGKYARFVPVVGALLLKSLIKLRTALELIEKTLNEAYDLIQSVTDFIRYIEKYLKVS